MMSIDHNRAFHYAVLASLVLHAVLLFGIAERDRPHRAEPQVPIIARLIEPPAPDPAPALASVAQPRQPEPLKPRPRAKPAAPKPPAKQAAAREPQTAIAPPPQQPVVADPGPEAAPPPAPPSVIARVEPAPPSQEATPAEPAPDPGSLAQYRLQIYSAARSHKRYPRIAIDNSWEGEVVVRMAMGANGKLAGLTVQSSSGYTVLDQEALEMFKKVTAKVPIPPALRGKEFALELRAIYNLRDQDSG